VAAHGRNILVDVSDPTHPKELKVLPGAFEGERYNDVKLYEAGDGKPYALFASAKRGIVTVDISDPLNAHEVAVFPVDPPYPTDSNGGAAEPGVKFRHGAGLDMSKTEVHTLFTETRNGRTLAYLAMRSHQTLDIWDITDARNPRKLGDYLYPGSELTDGISFDHIHDLYVEDGIAYLNAWGQGLLMLDCNDPSAPVLLGQYDSYAPRIQRSSHSNWVTTTSSGRRVSLTDDEDFTSYVHVVDVDPASPQFMQKIGGYQKMEGVAPHNIMAVGDRAYIAHYNFGLRVLDIADPTQPKEIAHYNTWDPDHNEYVSVFDGALGLDLDLENKLIYVIDWGRGLLIFKLTV
jgi:hypothetical protein